MRSHRSLRDLGGDERGAVGLFVGLGLVVLIGSAAIAIDLGHMMNVRTESQRVADLAALAGASAFIDANGAGVATTAEARAIDWAAQNTVANTSVTLISSDVTVDVTNERVRVDVHNTQARGNPITTVFARIFGINQVDIGTTAVAEAWPAAGTTCILPFFLPDRYDENGGDPDAYDPPGPPADYYEAFDPANPSQTATGYSQTDIGTQIVLKPAQGNQGAIPKPNPGWYYPLASYAGQGAAVYRAAIEGCLDPDFVFSIGDVMDTEPGGMIGPTKQGFTTLINQAPTHQWDPSQNCVVDPASVAPGACISGSPRVRPVPMMAPPDAPPSGRKPVPIANFAGVFVDRIEGNNVYVIFAGYSGVNPAAGGGNGGPVIPTLKTLRLIE